MQNYRVKLSSVPSKSYHAQKAADALDIDIEKKLTHELNISADLKSPYNVGLIVGSSGSGKTTLAKHIFGQDCFDFEVDESKPVIDQFPKEFTYDQRAAALSGIGLTAVPCWIRPIFTLSTGQKARALAALQMAQSNEFCVDEWTSTVDRTVAKAMSICLAKHAKRNNAQVVAVSCHYDIIEWLNPDWIIDCNAAKFVDRRSLRRSRQERLQFDIAEVDRSSWPYFSKYHYLSDKLPGGLIKTFGLFEGDNQIGFQCFANYTPTRKGMIPIMHSNRTVIHPDYVGFGLGIVLINATSALMTERGYRVMAKFSSKPIKRGFDRHPDKWKLKKVMRDTPYDNGGNMLRNSGFRKHVKSYSFEWIGGQDVGSVISQHEKSMEAHR